MRFIAWINRTNNVVRLCVAAINGLIVALILGTHRQATVHLMSAWLAFSFTYLFFSWVTILSCTPPQIKEVAKKQDSGRTVLFLFVLLAACISLVAILLLYASGGEKTGLALLTHIMLTLGSVGAAWTMVHTTFCFKYAHIYYSDGGLDFPGEKNPDYMDFIYFSFVIGTTFQVSDVAINNKRIRRIAWAHGLLSFAFNTIVLALSINIISSLIDK